MTFPESFPAGVALVQVTLVALLGLAAWLALRRGGPALRGAVLLASLVGVVVVPGLAAIAPTWLPLPHWLCPPADTVVSPRPVEVRPLPLSSRPADSTVLTLHVAQAAPLAQPELAGAVQEAGGADRQPARAEAVLVNLDLAAEEPVRAEPAGEPARSSWSTASALVGLWLAGVLLCLARALGRLLLLYRCAWRARPVCEQPWLDRLSVLARRHGLSGVELRESQAVRSPLTLGLFRAVILLPLTRRGWADEERDLILAHELAHVARRDFLAGLLAEFASCLCWCHPLVRWLAGRLRLEQEYAADAWVASLAPDSRGYVRCLARLALEQGRGRGSLAPALWRRRPEILRRIDMLRRNPGGLPARLGKRAGWAVAVLAAAACLVVAGVGPQRSAGDEQKPAESRPEARPTTDAHGDSLPAGALARLGTTRLRHAADVTFVSFLPDGKRLVTAGEDGTIRLWDLVERKEVRRFVRPRPAAAGAPKGKQPDTAEALMRAMTATRRGERFCAALSGDGKTLAATGGNVVQLWDVETGKELRKIEGVPGGLVGLLFSPDGRTLAGQASNGALFTWATSSGKQVQHIKPAQRPRQRGLVLIFGGGMGAAPGLAFTPDGKFLAAPATDYEKDQPVRSVKFHDLATGKEARRFKVPTDDRVSAVAISPDGKLLVFACGLTVHVCEAGTGKELRKLRAPSNGIASMVFARDGKALVVRTRDRRVFLWDVELGKELRQFSDAEPERRSGGLFLVSSGFSAPQRRTVALSPDGKRVAAAAGSTVRLWETATGKEVALLPGHWRAPTSIVLSPDGKTAFSWGADRVVRRWEAATGKALGSFPAPRGTTLAVFSRDGRTIALANDDNTIRLHDTATGKEVRRLEGPAGGVAALAFAPGGKVLASRGSGDDTVRLYDVARGIELRHFLVQPKPRPARGEFVLVLGGGRSAPGTGPGLAFSPDGALLAAPIAGSDRVKVLVLFDAASGKELRKIESTQPIVSFAFSPDGRSLATENADRTITLWETATGKERARFGKVVAAAPPAGGGRMTFAIDVEGITSASSEPAGPVGLGFSPDGRALAVRGGDLAVHVWDVAAGKEVGKLAGHPGRIETIGFAPNGKSLASGSADTTVLLWDAAAPLKELKRPQPVDLTADEVKALWADLAGADATKARQSIQRLVAGSRQAVPLLSKELRPAARIDPRKISGWIAGLDSEKFAVRRDAAANLLMVGEQAVPALRKVLASEPPLETRRRVEELIDRLTGGKLTAEQIRHVRAIEALERMGTPQARQVLRKLAGGAPGALPTREAQAALARLGGR